ncbi:hypothetical protein SteCoe_16279 [Stentor coeruleus]|uniref:Uncharacterized protein n=1 Tax=Stentor coeruleus TaxID=5963 RepID=A0A1R2C1S3_9CILI|nr:hypothetical protein SteCoe_16279 [Stentor coeruleus]
MSFDDEYRLDIDSFPSFYSKYKDMGNFVIKEEALMSSDNEISMISSSDTKALKEQIKTLEFDNKRLELDLEAAQHRFFVEKDALNQKITELKSSESSLKVQVATLQNDMLKTQQKSNETNDKHAFFNSQIEFLTKENKRINDQYKIDKENWELKLKTLEKLSKAPEDKEDIKSLIQLNKAEAKILELNNEISELKNKNEQQKQNYQKKIDFVDGEIKKLKQEEEKYIKELEEKNKNNEEIINQLNKRIKDIEKLVENKEEGKKSTPLRNPRQKSLDNKSEKSKSVSEKLSRSSKSPLLQSPKAKPIKSALQNKRANTYLKESSSNKDIGKMKTPIKEPIVDIKSNKNIGNTKEKDDKIRNLPSSRILNKAPSYLRKENQNNNLEVLEKEIAVLTGRYKYLLQMSQDASDVVSLRNEITKVAGEIEDKSNQLFAVKKKQQDFLKQQIRS